MTQTSPDPDEVDPALCGRLLRDAHRTGRGPVLLGPGALSIAGGLPQPDDVIAATDRADVEDVLAFLVGPT